MRISANGGANAGPVAREPAAAVRETAAAPRIQLPAVVPIQDRPQAGRPLRVRADAALLAQLAAVAQDHPSARARRRADPAVAAEAYRLAARLDRAAQPLTARMF